jgi:hypothetical protein
VAAVWMRVRAELRVRWRAWLGLALILGVAAGTATGAAAGARRTASAYPRFLESQDTFDAFTGGGDENRYEEHLKALKEHPLIEDYVELIHLGAQSKIPARRGRPEQILSLPDAFLNADPSGRALYETNRAKVVEGRLADRTRVDETMVPFAAAQRYGVEVGDTILAGIGFAEDFPEPVTYVPLHVVGITAAPGDFDAVGQPSLLLVYATPALYEKYRDLVPLIPDTINLGVHLRGGPRVARAFKQSVESDLNIDVPLIEPVVTNGVQKTMRLYSDALWLIAALIALASVTIAAQTLARQQMLESADYPELRSMGVSRGQLVAIGMLRALMIGGAAALIAATVAYLVSPLAPIGTPRIAEPTPGFRFDAAAIGIGVAGTFLLVPLLALIPAIRAALRASAPERDSAAGPRPSRFVERVARNSESASALTGFRLALEPGRGRTAVPVRTTILAVAVGVAAVTGSLVVGRSLTHLLATPALTGFTYDAIIPNESGEPDGVVNTKLRAFPFIEDTTIGTGLNVNFRGVDSFLVGFTGDGTIKFATIDGRAPTDAAGPVGPEIALGPMTIRRLGLHIGDTVEFGFASEDDAPPETQRARIVGVAAIPALPWAATEPGEGAVMTVGGIQSFTPDDQGGCCFVRFKPGTDLDTAKTALEKEGFETALRTKRSDLATLERISKLPILLSALFGLIAAAALVHVLVTGIRRRRRDLAILKTLGFVTKQVRGAVAWQASTIAVIAVVAGVPAGIALGRWSWRLLASQFGVVPAPVVPFLAIGSLIPIGVMLANVAAAVPGRIAARTQPALVLRTE